MRPAGRTKKRAETLVSARTIKRMVVVLSLESLPDAHKAKEAGGKKQ